SEVERAMHPHLARFGMTKYWNLYVFRVPDAPEPGPDLRSPAEVAHWEANLGLDTRTAADDDVAAVAASLGKAAAAAASGDRGGAGNRP
ncbi:MAG: hypothetical protein ACR2MO_02275, partial [Acidimicrobiales bacterium]